MIFLAAIVVAQRRDLRGDGAVAGLGQCLLIACAGILCHRVLGVVDRIDGAAIVAAQVVALTVALRGVVILPESLQDGLEAHPVGVEAHLDDLGMVAQIAHAAQASLLRPEHILVAYCLGIAAGIARFDIDDAWDLGHPLLGTPEATHAEHDRLRARQRGQR